MVDTRTCPKCGVALPDNAPAGICPKCLMQAALDSEPDGGSRPESNPTTLASGFIPPDPRDLARQFPQFEILDLVGRGGMGAVYKARQPGLDRLVAVKILPPEIGVDPAFAERFTREARALAKLSHQNIVSVFDFGQADGQYYIVMEFVDGTNLRQLIETGALKPDEALAIVPQICEALQFAHNEGIVHRDIKPENILIDRQGRVKIADFGLAKLLGHSPVDATLTGAHQVMGTPHYMAPEQMRGAAAVDHRADIYSLGVVFYEMLTGELPIGRFEPPSRKVQIDVRLDEVVLRSLENEPARRYQRVSEVKTDIEVISACGRPESHQFSDIEREAARRQVKGPGITLVILGVLNMLPAIAFLILLAIQLATDAMKLDMSFEWRFQQYVLDPSLLFLPSVPFGVVMLVAGLSMRRLGSYELSMIGTVTGMIPSGPVWLFSLPLSIWAMLVLKREDVKAAFSSGSGADRALGNMRRERSEPDTVELLAQQETRKQLFFPSGGMMLAAIINCIFAIFVLGAQTGAIQVGPRTAAVRGLPFVLLFVACQLPSVYVLVTAPQTGRLQSHHRAASRAIAALFPSGPGIVIGLPCAIWALLLLRRAESLAARTRVSAGKGDEPRHAALSE